VASRICILALAATAVVVLVLLLRMKPVPGSGDFTVTEVEPVDPPSSAQPASPTSLTADAEP